MNLKIATWQTICILLVNVLILWCAWKGLHYGVRKGFWRIDPRIVECRIRPATPLELSQGADVGVTTRAIVPEYPNSSSPAWNFSISRNTSTVWHQTYSEYSPDYTTLQEDHGLQLRSWERPIIVEANLVSLCRVFPTVKKSTELTTKGLSSPEPAAAQRPNFHVTKAALGWSADRFGYFTVDVSLDISQAAYERPASGSGPQCVENWHWLDSGGNHSFDVTCRQWSGRGGNITNVQISSFVRRPKVSTSSITKVIGLLSINNGWPQEITVEWPKESSLQWPRPGTKFTTKLAPLPKRNLSTVLINND